MATESVRNNSRYTFANFVIFGGSFISATFLLWVIITVIYCNARRFNNARVIAVVMSLLLVLAMMTLTVFLGMLSGFDYIPAYAAFLLSALLWTPTVMLYQTLNSATWRTAFLISAALRKEKESAEEAAQGDKDVDAEEFGALGRGAGGDGSKNNTRVRQHQFSGVEPGKMLNIGTSNSSSNNPNRAAAHRVALAASNSASGVCTGLASFVKACFSASQNRPAAFGILILFALCYSLIIVASTKGLCFCSNPTEITSWISRRSDPRLCVDGEHCHLYSLLGPHCGFVRVVGHVVIAPSTSLSSSSLTLPPQRGYARVCVVPDAVAQSPALLASFNCTTSTINNNSVTSLSWIVEGVLVPHAHIDEDRRYLVHYTLGNLTGRTVYRVESTFVMPGGVSTATTTTTSVLSRAIAFRTVACENEPASAATPVDFIGGGDVKQVFSLVSSLLLGALKHVPHPQFVFIGGDITYAQNMRTCYSRWDHFLRVFGDLRTSQGLSVPLLVVPGNHDAGGYNQEADDPSKYFFYPQYFPMQDTTAQALDMDPTSSQYLTITYHSHVIGRLLKIVCLDSGTITPIPSQVTYLKEALRTTRDANVPSNTKFSIVMFHNPAYPSVRSLSEDTTPEVRREFIPVIEDFRVPLVLEFHDHVYKRTFPMLRDTIQATGHGTVFVGDGALGVYDKSRDIDLSRHYLQNALPKNNIMAMRQFTNGSLLIVVLSLNEEKIDEFVLHRRL